MASKVAHGKLVAAKQTAAQSGLRPLRTLKAAKGARARLTGESILQRKAAFALAMADALRDILRLEQRPRP